MRSCPIYSSRVADSVYDQIKERVSQPLRTRKARRIVVVVCVLAALVVICAGVSFASHARMVRSTAGNSTNNSQQQSGANFSELEDGGLGS
jgi:hypothetical protein